ncbi:MAG: threonine/serine exporter family protein [Firmicutes bacterium]|nr:threonine/serine exporter family protein [Bacillota bacterium]
MVESLPVASETSAPASSVPEVAFVLELGRTLQTYGMNATTLEKAMGKVAAHLGIEGAIYVTPTAFLASLRVGSQPSKTYLQRVEAGSANLDKLAEAESVVDLVLEGRMNVAQAREYLAWIVVKPSRYPGAWVVAAFGLASGSMARIFGGGWREMALGAVLGLLVGLTVNFTQSRRSLAGLTPLAGGTVSALMAAFLVWLVPEASQFVLIMGGLIVLVPGLGLLVSMQELGTGNLVAGTARLGGSVLVFLLLAFGAGLGQRLGGVCFGVVPVEPQALPPWTLVATLPFLTLATLVIFQGRMKDYGWTLAATFLAWTVVALGSRHLGPEAGAGLAAWVLGAACNLYGRKAQRPAIVLLLPSLLVVLPGSLGFRGLNLLFNQQTLQGLQAGFQALTVTLALMLGLLVANATVPRRIW